LADNFEMDELFDDVAVSGEKDPDVAKAAQRPGECRRNGSQPAHPDEVIHFRGNEQDPQETPLAALELTQTMQEQFQFFLQVR
jgi:hypothetical protein